MEILLYLIGWRASANIGLGSMIEVPYVGQALVASRKIWNKILVIDLLAVFLTLPFEYPWLLLPGLFCRLKWEVSLSFISVAKLTQFSSFWFLLVLSPFKWDPRWRFFRFLDKYSEYFSFLWYTLSFSLICKKVMVLY